MKKNIFKMVLSLVMLLGALVAAQLVLRPTHFWQRAFGTEANLVVDLGSSFDIAGGSWRNLAQGGEENTRMLGCCTSQIKALGPYYIRIDHVFDYYDTVDRDNLGNLIFNWSKLDLTLNDIVSTGAKPFIALSYMPQVVSRGDVNELPNNWDEWELIVQRLVEHVSGKSGLNLSGVYYEVWNEPDLFGKFKTGGEKNYLDLYLHSYRGAVRAVNTLSYKIGGPATTGLYESWVNNLLKFVIDNNLRIDFLSWHRYSKDINDYEDDWVNVNRWLVAFPQYKNIELVISESGPNSENDTVYDGNLSAVHTIALAALLEIDISKIFTFEIKDGPGTEKYWGRWGILTHEKWGSNEAKPRYNAILFLNNMKGKKINVAGEGTWVKAFAKDDGGVVKLLVVNYDPAGTHYESVPIKFINLSFSKFKYTRIDLTGAKSELTFDTKGATIWETLEGISANSAAIFEITPI